MSVIKAMRGESAMQFIETARRLELHAFSVCTKAPKRYAPLLTNRIFELASTVHEEVRAANNIYPHNQHEAQMRRDHLINANIALQNLSPKLTLLYDAILQNPEKCPWIDHAMKEFGEYITDEAQLISLSGWVEDHLREMWSGTELEEDTGCSSQRLLPLAENEVHYHADRQGRSEDEP